MVAVPDMVPPDAIVKPVGSDPLVTANTNGARPPLADKDTEYGFPRTAFASVALDTAGAETPTFNVNATFALTCPRLSRARTDIP